MNELTVEVLFQFSFHIFMTLSTICYFLWDGVRQGHYSAKDVIFQKLMLCKRSVYKIRSPFFHLSLAVGIFSIEKAGSRLFLNPKKSIALMSKSYRTRKTLYLILRP